MINHDTHKFPFNLHTIEYTIENGFLPKSKNLSEIETIKIRSPILNYKLSINTVLITNKYH